MARENPDERQKGRKTVTESVEAAASAFTAPKNQLRGV